ncbi:MAG: hypothetical protein RML49_05725 [Verrucomicrobiae bacterium]|nr:hypothetical protein [Verrucomicrobiae bacterium]
MQQQLPTLTLITTQAATDPLKEFERREQAARALQGTYSKVYDHEFYVSYQHLLGENPDRLRLFERNGRMFAVEPMPDALRINLLHEFEVVGLKLDERYGPPITDTRILQAQDRFIREQARITSLKLREFSPRFVPSEREFRRRRP